jgi:hypothetical protein
MARDKDVERGVSLLSGDAVEGALWQGGKCTMSFEFVERYQYKKKVGKGVIATVLLVTFEPEEGEKQEEPYGVGSSVWGVSKDGGRLIPKAGQTGLGKNTDTMKYMIGPLEQALADAKIDWPDGFTESFDVTLLNGIECVVRRMPADREGMSVGQAPKKDAQGRSFTPTKLVVQSVESAPWAGGKAASKSKAKNDDDDEAPRGKAAAGKGGKKPADDDDVKETAIEWLVDLLGDADDKTVSKKDLEKAMRRAHKKDKEKDVDAVIEWISDDDNLELEKGWLFDGKNLTLDK